MKLELVLASSSVHRLRLLNQIGYVPDIIYTTNIDESALKAELPNKLATRLAMEKAKAASMLFPHKIVLAADTVSCVGRLILPKAMHEDEAKFCINKISGRRHRVYTAVCAIYNNRIITKLSESSLKLKHFSEEEIQMILKSKAWFAKAGGFSLQGFSAAFILSIIGSDSNIVGMPLHETYVILSTLGLKPSVTIASEYHDKLSAAAYDWFSNRHINAN